MDIQASHRSQNRNYKFLLNQLDHDQVILKQKLQFCIQNFKKFTHINKTAQFVIKRVWIK